jgi:polyribonucleotide nucleotidyltransferase
VECTPGKEGLVHVSELADFRVRRTEDVVKMGEMITVKCIGIDERSGKVRLSRKAAMHELEDKDGAPEAPAKSAPVQS